MASEMPLELSPAPAEHLASASSTTLLDPHGPGSKSQTKVGMKYSASSALAMTASSDVLDYDYYTATFENASIFRWEAKKALDNAKHVCMHVRLVLALIHEHGEEPLSTPSRTPDQLELTTLVEGVLGKETELEKAQYSLAAHHTAISECLKNIEGTSCGLPSYLNFNDKRNWFCHDNGTPDAETDKKGMGWVIDGAKILYEDLLPKVVTAITDLTALLNDDEAWEKPKVQQYAPGTWTRVDGETDHEAGGSGYRGSGDDDTIHLEKGDHDTDSGYYEYDDGIFTRPLRALYFRSRICRAMFRRVCDFTWNRQIEYCKFHGIDRPEYIDAEAEEELDEWLDEVEEEEEEWAETEVLDQSFD